MDPTLIPVLFLRLEGPLQAWGVQSRHRVRDTAPEPSRSGVIGLIACCEGRRRGEPLDDLAALRMAVRVDRPGVLWRDYHTVGAKIGVLTAQRRVKTTATTGEIETLLSQRHYLCDASFLVALTGPPEVLDRIEEKLKDPVWPPFLGRKSCPPATHIFAGRAHFPSLVEALQGTPWQPRLPGVDEPPERLRCIVECEPDEPGARIQFDRPVSFAEPRRMQPRYIREIHIDTPPVGKQTQPTYGRSYPRRMNYRTVAWAERRRRRGKEDRFLCVFCGMPSAITHHITYRHARHEPLHELRSVCRRCHDAVTMLESERGMGLDRVDPLAPEWRDLILAKRAEIDASRAGRRDPEHHRR